MGAGPLVLEVIVDGTQYSIHGIVHDSVAFIHHKQRFAHRLANEDNWLLEQGLGRYFGIPKQKEVIDFAASTPWQAFKRGLPMGFVSPFLVGHKLYRSFADPEKLKKLDAQTCQEYNQNREAIEPPYDAVETRSAYQAEFMRYWKPGEHTNIIVGVSHAPQIRFFLKNPIGDARIVTLAKRHVRLLNTNPKKYRLVKQCAYMRGAIALSAGMGVGVAGYGMAWWKMLHYIFP